VKFVKKGASAASPVNLLAAVGRCPVMGKLPALVEHLTSDKWDDGEVRAASTLLLFVDQGEWKCCLNDRDGGRVAFTTGTTVAGLLGALEEALQAGRVEWRASKPFRKGGRQPN